jgi:hypothetical protein
LRHRFVSLKMRDTLRRASVSSGVCAAVIWRPTLPRCTRAAGLIRVPRPIERRAATRAIALGRAAVVVLALASLARAAAAGPIELSAVEPRGVTLRLTVEPFQLLPADEDGRTEILVPGLDLLDVPGRAKLPYAKALIALPPGALAVASVVEEAGEEARDGVRLTLGERPVFRNDPDGLGLVPARERVAPILDGAWPAAPFDVGTPFTLRRQRVVVVRLQPFRYDEASGRLWTRRTLTVRVSFVGGPAAPTGPAPLREDRLGEPWLRGTVLNYEQGRAWREAPPAHAAAGPFGRPLFGREAPGAAASVAAFDETEPEVRVRIDSTGVWALDADQLFAMGYPTGVPVSEVSVHRHEYLPGVAAPDPPYATYELPIEVDHAGPGTDFQSGDRIIVYAQSWWERSGLAGAAPVSHAQRSWGEGDVVYATRVRPPHAPGLRVAQKAGWSDLAFPSLASYPWTRRYERNFKYMSTPVDTTTDPFLWTEAMLYDTRPDTIRFETNDLDNSRPAAVTVAFVGKSSERHFVWAAIRNAAGVITTVVDSADFSGKTGIVRGGLPIPGTSLTEGLTNSLRTWGKTDPLPPSSTNNSVNAGLDYFEVTYWRAYRALGGYLACNSGTASGDYEIFATGFTDPAALRVYDVTDSSDVKRLGGVHVEAAGSGFGVRFKDNAPAGAPRRYVAFDAPKSPPAANYSAVDRAEVAGVYGRTTGDYLLVVPQAFKSAVGPLIAKRQSQGLDVVLAPLDAVNDVFNGGRRSPYAIRRFLKHAYDEWNASLVLLVGDGSEDPQNFSGVSSKDWVPTQRILGPVSATDATGSFREAVVSDPWYAWCLDCVSLTGAATIPDLAVGRIPVNSLAEASAVVAKLVAYESVTPDQTWRRQMVLVSDDQYSGGNQFGVGADPNISCRQEVEAVFHGLNAETRRIILQEGGLAQSDPELFDLSYYLPNNPTDLTPCDQSADTCRCNRSDFQIRGQGVWHGPLLSRLNAGRLWWNYEGHANEQVLAHEDLYLSKPTQKNKFDLANDGKPFLFTAFSCHPNAFGHWQEYGTVRGGPSLGEDLVTLPNRGAIASWASTGYESMPSSNTVHLNTSFARALFADPLRDPGPARRDANPMLGEAIVKAEVDYYPGRGGSERDVMLTYNLLGDPATRISIGSPEAVVTANGEPVTSGQIVRLAAPGDTLQLEADLVSNARLDTLQLWKSVGAGAPALVPPASYTLAPVFPDPAGVGRRYHLSCRDTLLADSFRFQFRTVDRWAVVGTFDAVFDFTTVLRADGIVVNDGDVVSPVANFALTVLSPGPIDPSVDLRLTVNGLQPFTAVPYNGDVTRRAWVLTWNHPRLPTGDMFAQLEATGGAVRVHRFRVSVVGGEARLENALAFPNPFNDDLGTFISFYLVSASPADVHLRVYTTSGRLIYERMERGLQPGYHQLPWSGRDAEGATIANGTYLYRLLAHNASSTASFSGRLVKLRKPRHVLDPNAP